MSRIRDKLKENFEDFWVKLNGHFNNKKMLTKKIPSHIKNGGQNTIQMF